MTDYRIVPRAESGLPAEVYNNDGVTVRPLLPRPVQRIAIHYTGSPTVYGTPTLGKAQEWLRRIEANAIVGRKSNEYGYMVTNTDDGTVLEYAGLHWGAHSIGENDDTLAFLVLCGGVTYRDGRYVTSTEVPSDALVDKVRWLVAVLQALGAVAPDVEITLHRLLPDAATVCPGPAVESKVPAMRVPWVPLTPPPAHTLSHLVTDAEARAGWWSVYRATHESLPTMARVQPLIDANPPGTLRSGAYVNVPGRLP